MVDLREAGTVVKIREVVRHENFTETRTPVYDIALLTLEHPVQFTDNIRPICLYQEEEDEDEEEEEVLVAGWGRTHKAQRSPVLQVTSLILKYLY